ncbi:hypothetical protein DPEC_G00082970 [Dallia pectoralis]|uniref:Uncharacterized protein n=1 Tax=Dallia pectoralis TaxID=75939 RepID=A0ACC2GYV1_DALPE|nr:hypothetical protein DPEC_G00082970 [Dallia pectoralis]
MLDGVSWTYSTVGKEDWRHLALKTGESPWTRTDSSAPYRGYGGLWDGETMISPVEVDAPWNRGQDTKQKPTGACPEELSAVRTRACTGRQGKRRSPSPATARAETVGHRDPAMASSTMQILAFALALLGVLGATVATLLPNWKVSADVGSNIMTAISQMQGLWMDCTWYSTGVFSCTLKYSVLSLPAYLQTARTTMVLSCMTACLGLCLAALGLKCTRWGGSRRAKGHAATAAGVCFIAAGVLCLVPASWFTNEVITSFLDTNIPESNKYEPGGAVYATFVSAGFLLASGVIFCLSCVGRRKRQLDFTSTSTSTSFPDKLLQHQIDKEQLRRDELQRDLIRREQLQQKQRDFEQQTSPNEQSSNKGPQEKVPGPDDIQQENPLQEKPLQEDKATQQFYSPSRVPPKDARAGYSLKDYV